MPASSQIIRTHLTDQSTRDRTDQVLDLVPGQLGVLRIRRPDDATVLFAKLLKEVGTLARPLVPRHIDEPERQWLLVWHGRSAV